jgi:hypothetical protein
MDTILSARIDDRIARQIGEISRKMHTTKKAVIEKAIALLGQQVDAHTGADVFKQTSGAWKRQESAQKTVGRARTAFRESMHRHES